MLLRIAEIAVNISEGALLFLILYKKLGCRQKLLPFALFGILGIAATTTISNMQGLDLIPTILIFFTVNEIYSLLFFKGTIKQRLLWGTSMTFIVIITNTVIYSSFSIFASAEQLSSYTYIRLAMILTYAVVNTVFAIALLRFNEKERVLPLYVGVIVFVLCLMGASGLYLLLSEITELSIHHMQIIRCIIPAIVLAIFIFAILILLDAISKETKKQVESQAKLSALNSRVEYEEKTHAMVDIVKKIKHDYANHIIAISGYVNAEDYDGLRDYLKKYNTEYDMGYFYSTGIISIDSILTSKSLIAKHDGIDFGATVQLTPSLKLPDFDVTVILGNLLDNALEAQKSVTGRKYINLTLTMQKSMLCIVLENSSSGKYNWYNGKLASSKVDTHFHGYGLRMMREIVEKYKGIMEVKPLETSFITEIYIYIEGGLT